MAHKVYFNRDTDQMWIEHSDGTAERVGNGHPGMIAVSYVMAHMGMQRTSDWLIVPGMPHVRYCTATYTEATA